jgi:hypothetical protein
MSKIVIDQDQIQVYVANVDCKNPGMLKDEAGKLLLSLLEQNGAIRFVVSRHGIMNRTSAVVTMFAFKDSEPSADMKRVSIRNIFNPANGRLRDAEDHMASSKIALNNNPGDSVDD